MPPFLDVRTLVLTYVGISIGQAVVLLYLWSVQRNYPPAKDWAIGSLLFAIGLFLFALRNHAPVLVSEVVSNVFLLPGLMLFNFGVVKATGREPSYRLGAVSCTLAVAILAWFAVVTPDYPAAVLTQNTVFLGFDIYTAYACLSAKTEKGNHTFRLVGVLFGVLAAACVWRVTGGVFGLLFSFSPTMPRLFWIATSLIVFPMLTVLLTLHTSQRLQEEIHTQARRDTLTGAYNRRAFGEFADKEWHRRARQGAPLSVLSVDIDHFKQFNDQYGHPAGDAVLVAVSTAAQSVLRASDIWCRYGGEEFVALLPDTTLDRAIAVAERLRSSVQGAAICSPAGVLVNVSVSVGVAECMPEHARLSDVLALSDAALYRAKAAGRNKVIAAG